MGGASLFCYMPYFLPLFSPTPSLLSSPNLCREKLFLVQKIWKWWALYTRTLYIYIYIFIYIYPETTFNINKKTKKKVFLHTLSAYNSLLILYKIYSSDSRECLCTRWSYGKAYVYLIIAPAPCWKIPINNKLAIPKCQSLLLGENYTEKKNVRVKIA